LSFFLLSISLQRIDRYGIVSREGYPE